MDIIITVFTVLSMYLNLSSNPNSDYCYNADIENGVVNALYVFDNKSDYLTPTYAYQFTYDEAGRLSEKATYNWNKETKTYEPYYKLQFDYNGLGYELSHCLWSKNTQTWQPADESMVYFLDNNHLRSVTHYQHEQETDQTTVSHLFVQDPYEDYLLTLLANANQ
jgi:YD repeat-containing protein